MYAVVKIIRGKVTQIKIIKHLITVTQDKTSIEFYGAEITIKIPKEYLDSYVIRKMNT